MRKWCAPRGIVFFDFCRPWATLKVGEVCDATRGMTRGRRKHAQRCRGRPGGGGDDKEAITAAAVGAADDRRASKQKTRTITGASDGWPPEQNTQNFLREHAPRQWV